MNRLTTISQQMLRVGAASGIALCVDVAIYLSLLPYVDLAALAAFAGHSCGILTHFAVSSRLLLRTEMAHIRGRGQHFGALAKFFVAGGCGLAVTTGVVFIGVDRFGLHPLAGKAVAAAASFLVVFSALKLLVLQDRGAAPSLLKVEA